MIYFEYLKVYFDCFSCLFKYSFMACSTSTLTFLAVPCFLTTYERRRIQSWSSMTIVVLRVFLCLDISYNHMSV
jgi:hypothetical protein